LSERTGKAVSDQSNVGLHRLAVVLSVLTVALLVAGALVTSNEAGDSVPDWPLSFGRWLINSNSFVANVRYEYSHRFIAGIVGATTLLLAIWTFFSERRRWMRSLALCAFAGVVAQAAIGGLRVRFPEYKAMIAIPHALVAQSFFALIIAMAVFTSRSWLLPRSSEPDNANLPLRRLASVTVAAVLIQLVLGAAFRHQAFGIVPHIIGAIAVTVLIALTVFAVWPRHIQEEYLIRPARLVALLLVVQLGLGIAAYFARLASKSDPQPLEPMISLTVAHLVVGALTLATMVVLALRCHQVLIPARKKSAGAVSAAGLRSSGAAV